MQFTPDLLQGNYLRGIESNRSAGEMSAIKKSKSQKSSWPSETGETGKTIDR